MNIPPIRLPLPAGLTHHETLIVMWIGSDPPLLKQMRYAIEDSYIVAPDVQLSTTVSDLLWDPSYGVLLPNLAHVMAYGANVQKAAAAQASVSERALQDIDLEGWARICGALLAGLPLPEELS